MPPPGAGVAQTVSPGHPPGARLRGGAGTGPGVMWVVAPRTPDSDRPLGSHRLHILLFMDFFPPLREANGRGTLEHRHRPHRER